VLRKFFDLAERWDRTPQIALTGGEPLVTRHLWDIITFVQECSEKNNCLLAIMTNATLVDRTIAKKLSQYKVLRMVQVSLDGANQKTHETIRGKNTFAKTLEGIKNLADAGIQVGIHYTVHSDNCNEVNEAVDLAQSLNVRNIGFSRLVPCGRGKKMEGKMLAPQELKRLTQELIRRCRKVREERSLGKYFTTIVDSRCDWPLSLLDYYFSNVASDFFAATCPVGRNVLTIMPDGTVYPCRRLPIYLGNFLEKDFDTIWNDHTLWLLRRRQMHMKAPCKECQYLKICRGGAPCISYGCYGTPFKRDPQCWHSI
jgi:radical SAM protein with 4Fe4S-binding SPASM domain